MRHIRGIFAELEECRAFELLKGAGDRSNYLLTRQAKVVAMTCTHAALKRHDFLRLGFKYDNLVMEESAQVLDIETFIPMMLQTPEDGRSRLKRVVLIGDHHQLPPVVKNIAFQKYCNMDQSLFARFVRLGIPYVELNAQGRARPELSALYRWRYRELGDLPCTTEGAHALANPGFKYQSQFVDVADYDGHGETMPTPYFYQNLGEAEYLVSTYQYMRLIGYPASKISIVTTYRGQKHLIRDVVARRCANHPLFGTPRSITTVDKFQGQQNDYVLLSLVRTRAVGHVRDVRRLVVALSRARLGLYVFGRRALFEQCYELAPAFEHLLRRPTNLEVVTGERFPPKRRTTEPPEEPPATVADVIAMGNLVNSLAAEVTGTGMVGMVENVAEDGGPGVEISHQ
jgi:intron-binding protein aquarius